MTSFTRLGAITVQCTEKINVINFMKYVVKECYYLTGFSVSLCTQKKAISFEGAIRLQNKSRYEAVKP